jgi:hypothetical protein
MLRSVVRVEGFVKKSVVHYKARNHMYILYVCVYVWGVGQKIRPLHRDLQWCIVLPLFINPLLILHLEWSVGLCLWGRHSSDLVPWKSGPGDGILNKLWPHNHTGYVWLIHLLLGTFRKWGHQSIPVWNGAGSAVAQAVSHWFPTAAAWVRVGVACGVCGGQSGIGASFLRVLRCPLPIIPLISPAL